MTGKPVTAFLCQSLKKTYLEAYIILMDPNPTILGGQKVIQTTDIGLFFFDIPGFYVMPSNLVGVSEL